MEDVRDVLAAARLVVLDVEDRARLDAVEQLRNLVDAAIVMDVLDVRHSAPDAVDVGRVLDAVDAVDVHRDAVDVKVVMEAVTGALTALAAAMAAARVVLDVEDRAQDVLEDVKAVAHHHALAPAVLLVTQPVRHRLSDRSLYLLPVNKIIKKEINIMNKFTLSVNEETCNYLQRLSYEVTTRKDVIATLLEANKDAADSSVLDSVPFKHYHKLLEEAEYAYGVAKDEFYASLKPIVDKREGRENVEFAWQIKDFSEHLVYITVKG